jgi:hypothetical protein
MDALVTDEPLTVARHMAATSPLHGVMEWISLQGGTINTFNPGLLTGKVRGLCYRYFITEGWIGVRQPDCPAGQSVECRSLVEFVDTVQAAAAGR